MRYKALLKILRVLIYIKRFFWWLGARISFIFGKIISLFAKVILYLRYRVRYVLRGLGLTHGALLFKRGFLQFALLAVLFAFGWGQTKWSGENIAFATQRTKAYALLSTDQEGNLEEVVSEPRVSESPGSSWRTGLLGNEWGIAQRSPRDFMIGSIGAGGTAFNKPIILPGAIAGSGTRNKVVDYRVEPGDSLGLIAENFDVSVATIMWENGLKTTSIIRPGDVLRIPPTSGIMHSVKKGDTIKRIATMYDADVAKIIAFNHLKEDGSNLVAGERIMVPGGIKPADREIIAVSRNTTASGPRVSTVVARPPSSASAPSKSGWVWPSGSHTITQYYGISHHAIDIGGPWQTPTYAAKGGVVEKAQCGWNSGYGCYIVINHGGGVETLYGHHSALLVKAGETVTAGQTIGLMGNTGNVRGATGIHLHFEVRINGATVNPLGYVR